MRKYTDELVWALSALMLPRELPGQPLQLSNDYAHRIADIMRSLADDAALARAEAKGAKHERDWAVRELDDMTRSLRVLVGNWETGQVYQTGSSALALGNNEFVVCRITGSDFGDTIGNAVKVDSTGQAVRWPSGQEPK